MRTTQQVLDEINRLQREYEKLSNPLTRINEIDSGWETEDSSATKTFFPLHLRVCVSYVHGCFEIEFYDAKMEDGGDGYVYGCDNIKTLEECIETVNKILAKAKRKRYIGVIDVTRICVDNDDKTVIEYLEEDFEAGVMSSTKWSVVDENH